jgi:HK97 family phage major capsid protein
MVVAPGGDRWDGPVRHVQRVSELRDVSICTTPAYTAAAAELRHQPTTPQAGGSDGETTPEARGDANPEPARRDDPPPDPKEATVPRENPAGGLHVEDRSADQPTVEQRVLSAMAGVPQGEARDLTHATTDPVQPDDMKTFVWDKLRDLAVVLASGVPVLDTTRGTMHYPVITGDITADFYDELDDIVESDPALDDFEITPKAIKALVRGSSEAFEDSDPSLLQVVTDNLTTILGLRLDFAALSGNPSKGFPGMANIAGQSITAVGALTNYDPFAKALGLLAEAHVPGPYAIVAHPRVLYALRVIKESTTENNVGLLTPPWMPPMFESSALGVTGSPPKTTVLVYAPAMLAIGRRRDVTIEVDRSEEFSKDAVLVRGKIRAALGTPHPEAVVKLTGVDAPAIS